MTIDPTIHKKREIKGVCISLYCINKKRSRGRYCNSCKSRLWRKKHPMKASFNDLRKRAKQRGKEFTLTFEQFEAFCIRTKYIQGKGRFKEGFSIDRIDNDKGYSIDNIQVLTVAENASKERQRQLKILQYNWETQSATVQTIRPEPANKEDDPF